MPAERTTMRHVREVLRLKFVGGVPTREIARRIGVAASTVRATLLRRAPVAPSRPGRGHPWHGLLRAAAVAQAAAVW
jgi:hypothetical protein